jgi:predicted RNA methylase
MHKTSTKDYIEKYLSSCNYKVNKLRDIKFDIPKTYKFHKENVKNIEVTLVHAISNDYL